MTAGLDRITVTGTYTHFDDTPAKGSIIFEVPLGVRILTDVVTDEKLVPQNQEAILDADGHFAIALPATDDPDVYPTGWTYHVTELIVDRPPNDYFIEVSYTSVGGTLDLADVVPVDASSGVPVTYVPIQEFNALKAALAALQEEVDGIDGTGGGGTDAASEYIMRFDLAQGIPGATTGQAIQSLFGDGWTLTKARINHYGAVDAPDGPIGADVLKNGTTVGLTLSLADGETEVETETFTVTDGNDGDQYTVNKTTGTVQTRAIVSVHFQRL